MAENKVSDSNTDSEKDKFGLPKLSTEAEMGLSMTLFVSGLMMVVSTFIFYQKNNASLEVNQAYVGLLLIGAAYLFATEAVRELSEKDHYLASKLTNKE